MNSHDLFVRELSDGALRAGARDLAKQRPSPNRTDPSAVWIRERRAAHAREIARRHKPSKRSTR